jgi:hypothetical protein
MAITTTARQLIRGALLQIGAVAQGEPVDAASEADAFVRLNELVDTWSTQRLTQRYVERVVATMVVGQSTYTVGLTGDFNITRPTFVDSCNLSLDTTTPPTEIPLSPMTDAAYQQLAQKELENSQPTQWYYEPTMPMGSIVLWPVPDSAANTLVIYVPVQLAQFATPATSYTLAPAYARALRLNLAVELAVEFGRPLDETTRWLAAESLADVKRLNVPMADLALDPALLAPGRSSWNIYTGP